MCVTCAVWLYRALPACHLSPWLRKWCGFSPWVPGGRVGTVSLTWRCQRLSSALVKAASAPQFNVQLPVSSSEPRAVGPSRESLKRRKVQSCTGSFAIPIQGAFKLFLYFNCFTWIKTADKWKTQMLSGITVKLGCRSSLPCPYHHLKMTSYLWGESGLTQNDYSFPSSLILHWAGKGIV